MVFRALLIFLGIWLLHSCAQVGFLTGGEKDFFAPEPVRSIPENGSVSFSKNEVSLTFDEFVQLKDPQQNIFIVPNDAVIKADLKKKVLNLSWNETLKVNTTYVIYLNNAVVDASEGNSGLLSYVFSTGPELDTLTRVFRVVRADKNTGSPKTTVGLFSETDSVKPLYFSVTDLMGYATFNYLKGGMYTVRAFEDENKDLQISANENRGFLDGSIEVKTGETDTSTIRLFNPLPVKWISRFEFKSPGVLEAELAYPITDAHFFLNGNPVDSAHIRKVNHVVYRILPKDSVASSYTLSLNSAVVSDSSSLRITSKERSNTPVLSMISPGILGKGHPMVFQINSNVNVLDSTKIRAHLSKDSLVTVPLRFSKKGDLISIYPKESASGSLTIDFDSGAINTNSKSFRCTAEFKDGKEFGTLLLQLDGFSGPLLVALMKDAKPVQQRSIGAGNSVLFQELFPGEYTIQVTEDSNGNGFWDTGDLYRRIQPERINTFQTPVKIRPNWDVKLTLKSNR